MQTQSRLSSQMLSLSEIIRMITLTSGYDLGAGFDTGLTSGLMRDVKVMPEPRSELDWQC